MSTEFIESSALLSNSNDPFSIQKLTEIKTSGNTIVSSEYNGSTKTWSTTTKLGRTSSQVIDVYERIVSSKKGNQSAVTFTYTNALLTKIQHGTRATLMSYDSASKLLKSTTNALNQVTQYNYDAAERLVSTVLPDMRTIDYKYDFAGNLLSIKPPGRNIHNFVYDARELVGAYRPPILNAVNNFNTTYTYNNDKQLTKITRPDGKSIENVYDPTTGLLSATTQGSFVYTPTFTKGKLTSIKDNLGFENVMIHAGPAVGRMTVMKNGVQGGVYWRVPIFGTQLIAADGLAFATNLTAVQYQYDDDEYLKKAGDIVLDYDVPDGKLSGTTFFDIVDTYNYNNYGEVTGYTAKRGASTLYSYTLTRDSLGRITKKVETLSGVTKTFDYRYDLAGRLIEVKKNGTIVSSYQYDGNSNRIGGMIAGTTTSALYDAQDRLNKFNSTDYTYNLNGELLTKRNTLTSQLTTYTYDAFGNLRKVVLPGQTINYEIDALHRRFGRKVGSTLQKRFMQDPEGRTVGELIASNNLMRRYVYASKRYVPDYFFDSTNERYRIITDHLGSVRLVIKQSTGAVVQKMEHDEFGRVVQDTSPGFTPFGFASGMYDPDTKLLRFGARDYDPETGRWTSKDPILFNGGINLYGYANNDPVNFIDINGKHPVLMAIGAGALVGGAASFIGTLAATGSVKQGLASIPAGAAGGAAAVTTALAAAAGALPTAVGVGTGIAVDLLINFSLAPASLPDSTGQDFGNGINRLLNPPKNSCGN